jgi:hypothetical protein
LFRTKEFLASELRERKLKQTGNKREQVERLRVALQVALQTSNSQTSGGGGSSTSTSTSTSTSAISSSRRSSSDMNTAVHLIGPVVENAGLGITGVKQFGKNKDVCVAGTANNAGLSKPARAKIFTADERVRLAYIMADPKLALARQKEMRKTREELDSPDDDPFSAGGIMEQLFNDIEDTVYDIVNCTQFGGAEAIFDPNRIAEERNATTLNQQWTKIRSDYTLAYNNYSKSGMNTPGLESFCKFVRGDIALLAIFTIFEHHGLHDYVVRLSSACDEEGLRSIHGTEDADSAVPSASGLLRKHSRPDPAKNKKRRSEKGKD